MPSVASSSAAAVSQLGRCPRTTSAMTGASTDETATMNAERDGVVITRPAVWVMKPNATSAPSSSPPRSSRPVGRGETGVPGASSSAAAPNLTVRKANGVAWANALFTATKLVPQRKVASSSARSAWRRVTPSAGLVQHLAYLAPRPVGREGILAEGGPRVEHAVLRDRFVGVPGHVQHPRVRTQRRQPVRELAAAHLGHHHVGEQQVDGALVALGQGQRLRAARGHEHAIARQLQHLARQRPDQRLVLRQQDGLAAHGGGAPPPPAGRGGERRGPPRPGGGGSGAPPPGAGPPRVAPPPNP